MDKRYKRIVNIIGWIICLLTSLLYLITMYPTVCFWDSGEFIYTSSTLQVGHQPGAPLYQIIGSLISCFAFDNPSLVAPLINAISAIASGVSIMLLYHLFLYLFNKYSPKPIGNTFAAIISSLTFAFTDSFWTCSTESEVYALSFLFTTLCLHIIIQWEENPKEKYIVLLSFILGLSYCIHPLTLLIIPAIVFIIWFHYRKITIKGIIYSILISIAILIIYTNSFTFLLQLLSLSYWLTIVSFLLIISFLLYISYKKQLKLLNTIVFCALFFLIGCSLYTVTAIRSKESLPNNQYSAFEPEDLRNYIMRQAYIHPPLFYGVYYTALPANDFILNNDKLQPIFDKSQYTVFPRMWNYTSVSYEDGYVSWVGKPESSVNINDEDRPRPTFKQNLQFFAKYQIGYMYIRYLLWNFSGRTNDMQGFGDITNGYWQTGYYYTDKLIKTAEGRTSQSVNNKANNRYFAIPLILCLIGIVYHLCKDAKRFLFILTIFLMYSIALIVYNNMTAYETRERDYIFLTSFMAISLWMGIGILGISQIIANILRIKHPRYILPIFIIVPVWIFLQNIDDHNHHNQYTARNFAISMLNSCDKNAILFVDGDNDTYPLWYLQNVEKIRQDVKVINRQLLNNSYYINSLKKDMPNCNALHIYLNEDTYKDNVMDEIQIFASFDTLNMFQVFDNLMNKNNKDSVLQEHIKIINTNTFLIQYNNNIVFNIDNAVLSKSDIMILDIISSNTDRPIYFSSYSNENFLGLDDYLSLEGFAYRLTDSKNSFDDEMIKQNAGVIDEEKMYNNIMHGFCFDNFNANIYFNEIERNIITFYMENISSLAYNLLLKGEDKKAKSLIRKAINEMPPTIHYYPYSLADLSIISAALSDSVFADMMMRQSIKMFESAINRYNNGTVLFQSQNRIEAAKAITYFLNLCILAENWGLESLRIDISESFFNIIRPYLQITYRQRRTMLLDKDWYLDEIDRIDDLIIQIRDFASRYEEKLPEYE